MPFNANYKLILAVIPFISILAGGVITGAVPDNTAIAKVMKVLAEDDLELLMRRNGFAKTTVTLYQLFRIIFAVLLGAMIYVLIGETGYSSIAICILAIIGGYKLFYIYLVYKERGRIKKLNMVLPYTIKSIAYLANVYPVNNALLKAIDIVPLEFKEDLTMLCNDIDIDPTSFDPYQKFIDRYEGKLSRLDYYLKTLYRMSMSASKEEVRLLTNLNETISEEMSSARKAKNDAVNRSVTWLGLIPVALLTIMLIFIMIAISMSI